MKMPQTKMSVIVSINKINFQNAYFIFQFHRMYSRLMSCCKLTEIMISYGIISEYEIYFSFLLMNSTINHKDYKPL